MPLEATYLAWVDFAGTGMEPAEFTARVERQARIAPSHGPTFGKGGESFLRFNIGMPAQPRRRGGGAGCRRPSPTCSSRARRTAPSRCGHGWRRTAIAASKSSLIPIDSPARPWRAASSRSSSKCGTGSASTGGIAISPNDRQVVAAAGGEKALEPVRVDPRLLRLAPGIDLDEERRAGAARLRPVGEPARQPLAVEAVDRLEELERARDLVRLQRSDEVQLDPGNSARNGGQRSSASCTRFSPKTRCPASSTARTRASGCSLETATSVTASAGRPARASAAAIRAAGCPRVPCRRR